MATHEDMTPATTGGLRAHRPLLGFVLGNLVWIILLVALAGFGLLIPKFFQVGIFLNILEQSTFVGIIAVGLSLTLIAGQMDLSIELVMALAAMAVALTFGTGGQGAGWRCSPPGWPSRCRWRWRSGSAR